MRRIILWITAGLFILSPAVALADTVTFTPSLDGFITYDGGATTPVSSTWSVLRGQLVGTSANSTAASEGASFTATSTSNVWRELRRSVLFWQTGSLPDNAIIDSVQIRLFGASKADGNSATPTTNIVTSTATGVTTGSFSLFGNTALAQVAYANFTVGIFNDFNLTVTSGISLTGTTTFGFRTDYDMASTSPPWVSGQTSNVFWNTDNTSSAPILSVTYHEPIVFVPTNPPFTSTDSSLLQSYVERYGRGLLWTGAGIILAAFLKMLYDLGKEFRRLTRSWFE